MKNKILILTLFIISIINLNGIYTPYSIFEELPDKAAQKRSKWLKELLDSTQKPEPPILKPNNTDLAINEIIKLKNQNSKQIKDKRKLKRIYIYPEIFTILSKYNLCSGITFTKKFWEIHTRGTKLTWKNFNNFNPKDIIILDANKVIFNEKIILDALNIFKKSKNYRKGLSKFICNVIEHCNKTITSNKLDTETGWRLIKFN